VKPEVVFGLEGAVWPALLVSASGTILRANAAGMSVFGGVLAGDSPLLSAIWSLENGGTDGQFLLLWEQQPTATADLKFRTATGVIKIFTVAVCTFNKDGQKWYVLQLLPAVEPVGARAPTSVPVPVPISTAPVIAPSVLPVENKATVDAAGVALKQKLDCALQLARTVSLDFNNALTSVLGHTSLLLGKAEAGHPWRHSLMEMEKAAARAAEIANELAVFSRQEKETRKTPPGNVNAVVSRCVDFFRNSHGEKITWKVQLENGLFGARFDEAKVQQAVTKVLENAAEAVGAAGTGQIAVQTRNVDLTEATQDRNVRLAAGAYVCVEIADNGPGIDAEVLPRIFDPFFTTKGKTHRGLGLALAYGIMTNHGGGVAISSQPGAGTSARIYLPAEKGLVRESSIGSENLNGTETILVVDDESLVLTMAETILTEFGYKILTANGGQKALAILSREDTPVDMVVTDLVMPGMGGRELIERIRELAPAIKILCMSGYLMPADKQIGAAYLQKPFTSQELLSKVKQTFGSTPVD
jgi:two-component system, cell cycle sensor histidine kinase and response regulator CckA